MFPSVVSITAISPPNAEVPVIRTPIRHTAIPLTNKFMKPPDKKGIIVRTINLFPGLSQKLAG
jgi:hypothetical protein